MTAGRTIILASSSPRRRALLEQAGYRVCCIAPRIDDGGMAVRPAKAKADCASLAWFKAAQVWIERDRWPVDVTGAMIVAADTVCVVDGFVLGKPRDAVDARTMLERAIGRDVRVVSGVCLLDSLSKGRELFADEAIVRFGAGVLDLLGDHLAHESWRDRAGGFNLQEVAAAGWPFECIGDPSTVIGLPMRMINERLGEPSMELES